MFSLWPWCLGLIHHQDTVIPPHFSFPFFLIIRYYFLMHHHLKEERTNLPHLDAFVQEVLVSWWPFWSAVYNELLIRWKLLWSSNFAMLYSLGPWPPMPANLKTILFLLIASLWWTYWWCKRKEEDCRSWEVLRT